MKLNENELNIKENIKRFKNKKSKKTIGSNNSEKETHNNTQKKELKKSSSKNKNNKKSKNKSKKRLKNFPPKKLNINKNE